MSPKPNMETQLSKDSIRQNRKILFAIVTIFVGTFLVLVLIELYLRTACPEITPRGTAEALIIESRFDSSPGLRPNATGLTGNARVEVDALGFWKYAAVQDTATDGWLLLGDSVTMGMNIEADSTFAGRLAMASKKYRIMNASWIGYSSTDYLNAAKSILNRHSAGSGAVPTIRRATVFWTLNDIYADCTIGQAPGQAIREKSGAVLGWVRRNYITYQWLKNLFFDRSKDYFLYDLQFYGKGDVRFRRSVAVLDSLRLLCLRHSVKLDVVLLPYEYQLRDMDPVKLAPQRLMAAALDSLKIPWTDAAALPEFRSGAPNELYLFGDGIHFSNRGHRAVFDLLVRVTNPL